MDLSENHFFCVKKQLKNINKNFIYNKTNKKNKELNFQTNQLFIEINYFLIFF